MKKNQVLALLLCGSALALLLGLQLHLKLNKIETQLKNQHALNYKQQVYEDYLLAGTACLGKVVDNQGGKKVKSEEKHDAEGNVMWRGWCAKAQLLREYYWSLKLDYIVQSDNMDSFDAEHYFYLNGMGVNELRDVPPAHEAGK